MFDTFQIKQLRQKNMKHVIFSVLAFIYINSHNIGGTLIISTNIYEMID